jgi:Spy/CpxP family protein refolding chaperone
MKMNRPLLAAIASIGMGAAVIVFGAEGTDNATTGSPSHRMHPVLGPLPDSPLVRTTLRATHQLNLTTAQKSQIRTLLENAHAQAKAHAEANPVNREVLGNPSAPGYSAAVQTLKTHAADRIQRESDLQTQIVNVLTPQQKQKLPTVLAGLQTKREQRRSASAPHPSDTMR